MHKHWENSVHANCDRRRSSYPSSSLSLEEVAVYLHRRVLWPSIFSIFIMFSQLHKILTYVPNKWITYVLTHWNTKNVTLASISIALQHEMQELVLDLDFILSLNEMFGMNHIEFYERLNEFQFYIILWKCFNFKMNWNSWDVEIKC